MYNGSSYRQSAYAALLAAALTAPIGAQQGGAEDDPAVAPRSCLPHPSIDRTKILNGRNIVFVTQDDTIYNNELPEACPSLKRNSLVNYGIANGRVCSGDKFQVLWETTPRNYMPAFLCELGTFVPITEAELEHLMAMTEETRGRRGRGRSSREAVTTEQLERPRAEALTAEETSTAVQERAPAVEDSAPVQ
jgi:hypothetical protein